MLDCDKQKLVLENLNLVYHLANKRDKYRNDEDAIQYGMLGLCQAADRFDPSKGIKFSTFAYSYVVHWLDGEYSDIKYKANKYRLVNIEEVENSLRRENDLESLLEFDMLINSVNLKLRNILILMFEGYTQKEIADKLGVTKQYINNMIKKFKESVNYGREQGRKGS